MRTALTIAGSDSGGGAGIQADLKTFSALGVFGMSAIVSVTAQNTLGVRDVADLSPKIIGEQMDAVFQDIPVGAVKIGMVSNSGAIDRIAEKLSFYQPGWIVLDPVMVSKSGYDLLKPEARKTLTDRLLPLASVVTPNLFEASKLVGRRIDSIDSMHEAALEIFQMGPKSVLVKGGHLLKEPVDVFYDGRQFHTFEGRHIDTKNTHGTGCTLSSAIAAYLARGKQLKEAVGLAKDYVQGAIEHSLSLGHGFGPTHHFYRWYPESEVLQK
ncbi:bifunctional hydroxymethylpyrimidine kinase/phosphomethylpyrimidine kinase [Sporolactobacillus sp. THM19-2]|uniref:bifunctional hydroxymethylpyrimidine kinase/phosphomethylpyrimidine kinase n=1 Tax=Sporolactobacillus sp. THM19-2 TaxID=2511171 RepID=UPI00101FBB4B|nr:bifunctional hydroxymethylpyrimidine kinase/phosphomethylpyrimidine kinase [Sporolactobacillus sp. THM19-2]RYL93992.1 bifunctional hydroxymethylpyrimidine kinase/phosphomethylpyrimidine kinase [Sporolactobacillus sp. THM19-2]